MLWVPSIREVHLMVSRKRAFFVVAPFLWNTILLEIRLAPSHLDTFLEGPEDVLLSVNWRPQVDLRRADQVACCGCVFTAAGEEDYGFLP